MPISYRIVCRSLHGTDKLNDKFQLLVALCFPFQIVVVAFPGNLGNRTQAGYVGSSSFFNGDPDCFEPFFFTAVEAGIPSSVAKASR